MNDNEHGDLTETGYTYDPLSTPSVTTVYNRRGQPSTTTQDKYFEISDESTQFLSSVCI